VDNPKRLHRLAVNALAGGVLLTLSPAAPRESPPAPPSILLDGFYRDVAVSGVFEDFKQFADATPKESPAAVFAAYSKLHDRSPAALRRFVQDHFTFDHDTDSAPAPGLPLAEHIAKLWPYLTRSTRKPSPYSSALPLPKPYVVPGGRFHELYYWDSYFTMLGFGPAQSGLRDGLITDFARELHVYGHIPNGSRTYYLSRSQPPFFFKMVALTAPGDEAKAYARFLPELKIEYAYWMSGSDRAAPGRPARHVVMMPDHSLLNRYWDDRNTPRDESYAADLGVAGKSRRDPQKVFRDIRAAAESGWDFSSRWLADRQTLETIETTAIVPADLNSLLFGLERAISEGCAEQRDRRCQAEFAQKAAHRRVAMNKYLWNGKWIDDYRWTDGKRLGNESAAAFYPLFVSLATDGQAHATAAAIRSDLVKPGGLATTTRTTGQQWDAPNGWAPLQWIAVMGLRNYGETALARTVACRWLATVSHVYAGTGRLLEKYDVVSNRPGGGGEYRLQDGFGWTNGVTVALLNLYPNCPR